MNLSRRKFISGASCAALGTTGLLSTLLNIGVASRAAAAEDDEYKALICLFLVGGNDSFNMLLPTVADEFACYTKVRGGLHHPETNASGLALALESLAALSPTHLNGRTFGLHPSLGPLSKHFASGHLSLVANVGSLREPFATVRDYRARRGDWPLGLFSHSDQQQQWQTCVPDARSGIGWAGRAMDILQRDQSATRRSTFNISLSGMNILQTGREIVPYTLETGGLTNLAGHDRAIQLEPTASLAQQALAARTTAFDSLMQGVYGNVFERTYARTTSGALDSLAQLQGDLKSDAFPTWLPDAESELEKQLKLTANVISAYQGTGVKRQTFFIALTGFDMHSELVAAQAEVLSNVGAAVGSFWNHLPAALKSRVSLFTASDFARTLTGNGQGSDHAWGGNHFVLSGAINGGRIFGDYPIFAASSLAEIDVGQGRLIPSYSVEEYLYPTLKWFGLSDNDLFSQVFPGYSARFGSGGIRKTFPLYQTASV